MWYNYNMTSVSHNARLAIRAVDDLQSLYSGIVNDPKDRANTGDLLKDLRNAIIDLQKIVSRIAAGSEGNLRSELKQEHDAKSSAQTERYANGPSCD